jgi:oxygen-dependent protoporphyrinogen oxidase
MPSLKKIHSVTVMVVSLYYSSSDLLPEPGFGYLIPRSIPFAQNPECALGVSFDSFSSVGQDTVSGTKVTVMLGGHWWDGFSSYPDNKEGVAMAKNVLRRHLGINIEPVQGRVGLKMDCIPQYHVGYNDTMNSLRSELISAFQGKLIVTGNAFTGVGVHDCVEGALDTCQMLTTDIIHRTHAGSRIQSNAPPPFAGLVYKWPRRWER